MSLKKIGSFGLLSFGLMLGGLINVSAASVTSEDELAACLASKTETECVLGKDFESTTAKKFYVLESDKTLDLNGFDLTTVDSIYVDGVKLTVNDSKDSAVYTCNKTYGFTAINNGTIIINGGTFNCLDGVLTGNNTKGDMNLEVNGGTLNTTRGAAIYMPSQGILKINGGTLNGGINFRIGQVTISGGTINNTNSTKNTDIIEKEYKTSGSIWFADAIAIMSGYYTSSNATYGNSINLKITGGTINSTIGNGLTVYSAGVVKQDINIDITGGTINGKDAAVVVRDLTKADFIKEETYKKETNDIKTSITGGTFSHSVADFLTTSKEEKTDDGYVVKENLVLEVTDKDGNEVASFESEKGMSNDYQLVVEDKKVEDESKVATEVAKTIEKEIDTTKTKIEETKLLGTYDITVKENNQKVEINGTDVYKISLKVADALTKDFNSFKVAYLNDNNEVVELFDATLDNGNIVFKTTHLSTYAVIGYKTANVVEQTTNTADDKNTTVENTAKEENPNTLDAILTYSALGLISVAGLAAAAIAIKKRFN